MDTRTRAYPVSGGWQATDDILFISCFGRDEAEARSALETARARAGALAEKAAELRALGSLYGDLDASTSD